jgi:RNA polymerase sigma factor (TIGR02999 family)
MSVENSDKLTEAALDLASYIADPHQQEPAAREALDDLFAASYQELRGLAYSIKRSHVNATLNPTALLDEVYLRMAHSPDVALLPKLHFKRIAGCAMRQILTDAARRRLSRKRGGDCPALVITIDDSVPGQIPCDERLLALHEALSELGRMSPRQSAIVEHRYFGGSTEVEIAQLLRISPATVQREWRLARAWLIRRLS